MPPNTPTITELDKVNKTYKSNGELYVLDPNSGGTRYMKSPTQTTPTQPVQNNPITTPTQNPINIGQAYGSDTDLDAYNNVGNYYKGIAEAPIDENAIRQQKLDQIQAEINAQNAIYADKLSRARTQGTGRLGEDTARQARGGLIGSDFGAAQTETTRNYNTDVENSIENERNAVVERIRTQAKNDASAEIAAKRAAKEAGYKEYTAYLTQAADRKAANTDKVIKQLLASGLDPTTADKALIDEIAKNYGISSADVINGYKLQSYSTQQSEKARKQALADDIAKKGPVSLAEGNRLYDPTTGKEIAYNPKTYAPKASDSDSGNIRYNAKGIPELSSAAQTILGLMNIKGGKLEDYVKGDSKEAQNLRNEVNAGLLSQGGTGEFTKQANQSAFDTISTTVADLKLDKDLAGTYRVRQTDPNALGSGLLNLTANEYTDFVNKTDLLKGQLLRLDGVALKEIFGPQISNADAASIERIIGQALDPRGQQPTAFNASLDNILNGIQKYNNTYKIPAAPVKDDGAEYNYERDMAAAENAIAQGADKAAVMARFNAKYK